MINPICTSCKNHIYIARDGAAICKHVENEHISAYKWACIWCGDFPCAYYEERNKKDKKHLSANDRQVERAAFKGGKRS